MAQANPNIPAHERLVSLLVFVVLLVVAGFIFRCQFFPNPAVVAFRDFKTEAARETGNQILPIPSEIFPLPEPLHWVGTTERYDAQSLSDKIDGKAELYLDAGFRLLNSQRISFPVSGKTVAEVFLYEMNDNDSAFSVFSAQRREDAVRLVDTNTADAYRTENALFAAHGSYYLEIIAPKSLTGEEFGYLIETLKAFTDSRKVEVKRRLVSDLFPEEDRIEGSLARIATDAFGLEGFSNVHTAGYRIDQRELTLFVASRESPAAAVADAGAYRAFLKRFGGIPVKTAGEPGFNMIEIIGLYEIVFAHGNFLAGVREADSPEQAIDLAKRLRQHLEERHGE